MGQLFIDARNWQIATQLGLLLYGLTALDFDITWTQALATLAAALWTQALCERGTTGRLSGLKSAAISGLSLCLLLRTNEPELAALAAVLAIGSKFLLRVRGQHLYNPSLFGLVALLLLTDDVWVSPGQWGSVAFAAFGFACAGGLVVMRAARADVSLAFLAVYVGLVFARTMWLGDPFTIPLHRLQSGSLLLFAFFMISDPKTTPAARAPRLAFAAIVATVAFYWQFYRFDPNGLLWALASCAPLVPLFDSIWPGRTYQWHHTAPKAASLSPGPRSQAPGLQRRQYASIVDRSRARARVRRCHPPPLRLLRLLRREG